MNVEEKIELNVFRIATLVTYVEDSENREFQIKTLRSLRDILKKSDKIKIKEIEMINNK